MPFSIIRDDIIHMRVDAIVNAANTELRRGGGVCGAIFQAAGSAKLEQACDALSPIKTGEAVVTPAFDLPAKHIIHAVGPIYKDGKSDEAALLRACYTNALRVAAESACESIAFPLISSGIYGYPKGEALKIATDAITHFLENNEMDIYLAVFDKASFSPAGRLLGDIESYIDQHYADKHLNARSHPLRQNTKCRLPFRDAKPGDANMHSESFSNMHVPKPAAEELDHLAFADPIASGIWDSLADTLDEPFSLTLLKLIDAKHKTDVEVYKRANIDRRLFSKIKNSKDYTPSKRTILALAIALELTLDETRDLLKRAGYALSQSQLSDVIIEYFILHRRYDIFEINEVLFFYDQALLGGSS